MPGTSSKQPAAKLDHAHADGDGGQCVAPAWHTTLLVALIVAVAVVGKLRGPELAPPPAPTTAARLVAYGVLVVVEWGLLAYVTRVWRPRGTLAWLVGQRWSSARRACADILIALATLALLVTLESLWARVCPAQRAASVPLPATAVERVAWLVAATSAGFCEEVVYRGYLQTQLAAFTRRVSLGIVLQAALFGLAHAELGTAASVRIAVYGAILGLVAATRRSLVPGILAHVALDALAAL